MSLFGSSGIRGLVFEEISLDLALDIGKAVGSLHKKVVLGRDTRTSGEMFKSLIVSGLLSSGTDAYDAGVISTPTLAWAGREFDCGLMITASHNPGEFNGVKFWNPNGLAFLKKQRDQMDKLLRKRNFKPASWDKIGVLHQYENSVSEHKEAILSSVGESDIKVVVDCGNGATFNITPFLLRDMGCEVITLNAQPDGRFPSRMPEPTEKNLSTLIRTVKSTKADLGIAHDGDGDRMTAVDEKGRYIGGDKLLSIFTLQEVKKSVVVPVDASMVIDDLVPKAKVYRTRVGDVFVGEEIEKRKADFGGEPSGTWIFPRHFLCPDGVYAAALLARMVSKKKLSKFADKVPEYPQRVEGFKFDPKKRKSILKALDEKMGSVPCEEMTTVDGWRLQFKDGWALVRLSGTEPKIRLKVEARTLQRVKEIYRSIHSIVKDVLR
ncbi:MAG: phosphoglucosamine mutase [Methanomassiliicoccales archaeon]|nr:MAG: phosphoglucosamine mutase [Methanomassiliicoccales archaeon]